MLSNRIQFSSLAPPLRLASVAVVWLLEALGLFAHVHPLGPVLIAPALVAAVILFYSWDPLQRMRFSPFALRMPALLANVLLVLMLAFTEHAWAHGRLSTTALWWAGLAVLPAIFATVFLAAFRVRDIKSLLTALLPALPVAVFVSAIAAAVRWVLFFSWDTSRFGTALQSVTFAGVYRILKLFYPLVKARPNELIITTPHFGLHIAGGCSGVESLSLLLVLGSAWLIHVRRELVLSRAVWLLPAGLLITWCFNVTRIAILMSIGEAGHPALALNGFHSHAGWIAFDIIGIAFVACARFIPWMRRPGCSA